MTIVYLIFYIFNITLYYLVNIAMMKITSFNFSHTFAIRSYVTLYISGKALPTLWVHNQCLIDNFIRDVTLSYLFSFCIVVYDNHLFVSLYFPHFPS